MKRTVAVLLLAAAFSGCGGGGAAPPPAAGVTSNMPVDLGASITTTILVPGTVATESKELRPQYVSASTLGLKVVVTDVAPTGQSASFSPITSVYALTTGLNQIVIPTPATATGHSEDLTYVAYTLAPVSNAIPGGAKPVGWGLSTGFVVLPGQNTNNVVLSAVADGFPTPLAETGAFGMMSITPPVLAGAQASLGFGGNAVPSGLATLDDAGGNDITSAGVWSLVGAVPSAATTVAGGVPVTIVETAGTCGSVGSAPHALLSYDGGALATSATLVKTTDTIAALYDGNGGVGWSAVVSAKAQSQTLSYTLSSLGVTAVPNPSNTTDWACATQTLSFSQSNETALMTIVEHVPAPPYTITEPNTSNCSQLVNVYSGNSTAAANLVTPGTPTSLGTGAAFTVQLISAPPAANACTIEIQDKNAASTGGAAFPGATTYVQALLPSSATHIIVP